MTRPEFAIEDLGGGLHLIDAWMEERPGRLACYLFDGPERVLVECGPSSTVHHLVAALDDFGIDDLSALLVTHIHLDHAGAAGFMAKRFPGARIGVHAKGARHLIDPTRLWSSATRAYGGEERTIDLWGRVEPVDEDRVMVLEEGSRVPLGGGRSLEVLHTPGHAKHHVVFFDPDGGGLFIGDSAGVTYGHGHLVQPVTPPPDFDPELVVDQLHRMAALDPAFIGFAHFGPETEVSAALAEAERRVWDWVRFVEGLPTEDPRETARLLRDWVLESYGAEGYGEDLIAEYDRATYWPMQTAGILRWLEKRS